MAIADRVPPLLRLDTPGVRFSGAVASLLPCVADVGLTGARPLGTVNSWEEDEGHRRRCAGLALCARCWRVRCSAPPGLTPRSTPRGSGLPRGGGGSAPHAPEGAVSFRRREAGGRGVTERRAALEARPGSQTPEAREA